MKDKDRLLLENGSAERGLHATRLEELGRSSTTIWIASPYLTHCPLLSVLKTKKVRLLTSLNMKSVVEGAICLDTVDKLLDAGVEIRSNQRLHAKVYIFDKRSAVVSSANMTNNAFKSNLEAGVEILDNENLSELSDWYMNVWNGSTPVGSHHIQKLREEAEPFINKRNELTIPEFSFDCLPDSVEGLFQTATRYFLCNSNRRHQEPEHCEDAMLTDGVAMAWSPFGYSSHMERVLRGDAVFLYANQIGVIAIGVATGPVEVFKIDDVERIYHTYDEDEWRIPVKWLNVRKEDACSITPVQQSFLDISDAKHRERRNAVKVAFTSQEEGGKEAKAGLGLLKLHLPRKHIVAWAIRGRHGKIWVLKGSRCCKMTYSFEVTHRTGYTRKRELLESSGLIHEGRFERTCFFDSPSAAASVVSGNAKAASWQPIAPKEIPADILEGIDYQHIPFALPWDVRLK